MKYIICENGHKVKITGSITKKSRKGVNRNDRTPEYDKLCVRCHSNIIKVINA